MQQKLRPPQPGTSLHRQVILSHDRAVSANAKLSRDQSSAEVTASLRELPWSSIQACWRQVYISQSLEGPCTTTFAICNTLVAFVLPVIDWYHIIVIDLSTVKTAGLFCRHISRVDLGLPGFQT